MIGQQVFNGLTLGMAYALIAVGYSLVFGILRLVNFSHGSVYAFGAHAALLFVGMNVGLFPAVILSMVLTGVLGIAIDKTALEPLRKKKSIPIASLITTIGISNIIQNLLTVYFGSEKKAFPALFDFGVLTIGGIRVSWTQICMCLVSLILMLVLVLGGIGSLPGALVGGLFVGVSESMAATFLGSTYRDSMAFIILIIVLIVRPNGLFGRKGITKV